MNTTGRRVLTSLGNFKTSIKMACRRSISACLLQAIFAQLRILLHQRQLTIDHEDSCRTNTTKNSGTYLAHPRMTQIRTMCAKPGENAQKHRKMTMITTGRRDLTSLYILTTPAKSAYWRGFCASWFWAFFAGVSASGRGGES